MREDQKFTINVLDTRKQTYSRVECSFTLRPIDLPDNAWRYEATLLIHTPHELPGIQIQRVGENRSTLEPLTDIAYTWSPREGDKIIIHGDPTGSDETHTTIWKLTDAKVPFMELTSLQKAKDLLIQAMKAIQSGYPIGDSGIIEFPSGLGGIQGNLIQIADKLDELSPQD